MVNEDGIFEVEVDQPGILGVFEPSTTVFRGTFTAEGLARFRYIERTKTAKFTELALKHAVLARVSRRRTAPGILRLTAADFVRSSRG